MSGAEYRKGDLIGQKYEVYGTLGKGGFGVVYLVYSHETRTVYALKTFRDEYLADAETRARFRKEAEIWVRLERHPFLVQAYFVEEVAGRLYTGMEFIPPDECGLSSLEARLLRRPPDLAQSLRWSIQFCHGMEYAYSRGLRCHRDIKPSNILIGRDKTVKIADFGLAGALGASKLADGSEPGLQQGRVGLSIETVSGQGFGTPTHMPPEQFTDAASCDQRSDVYAFGVVLYQMATGGQLPFLAPLPANGSRDELARFWWGMYWLHLQERIPRPNSPLLPVILRCLEKDPTRRYQSFQELRSDLEPLLKHQTGETVGPPELKNLEAWEWVNKGFSLNALGRYEEAVACYGKALEVDPRDAAAWNNKGISLHNLGRSGEAIYCYDRALDLDPGYAKAWSNKGACLSDQGHNAEAIQNCDKALAIDPALADAWYNKGVSLHNLNHGDEALGCYEKALELDPAHVRAWNNKGQSLKSAGRCVDAALCFDRALEIAPDYAIAWYNKARVEEALSRGDDAARSYRRFLSLEPTHELLRMEYARQRLGALEG